MPVLGCCAVSRELAKGMDVVEGSSVLGESLQRDRQWESVMLAILAAGIVLAVGIPVLREWKYSSENHAAQVALQQAIKDVERVYVMEQGFTGPNLHGALWPYLNRRFPLLRWAKVSANPSQVAVARSDYGRRQSVELGVFAMDGVCWEAIAVMSDKSVALAGWAGLLSPGIYYGATVARSCGPRYITPPGSRWWPTLSRVEVP